jgi:hypothetical protein
MKTNATSPAGDDRLSCPEPQSAVRITTRDSAILDAITLRVRVLSLSQIVRWFWNGERQYGSAVRRMNQLARAGLVEVVTMLAGTEIALLEPLIAWRPGEPPPNWEALLTETRSRWVGPVRTARCVVATRRSAVRFGGVVRPPRNSEVTHDLHLSQIYLRLRAANPHRARHWVGEFQCLSTFGGQGKVPDALLRRPGQLIAVEVVGASYGARKLEEFHRFCVDKKLAYELW